MAREVKADIETLRAADTDRQKIADQLKSALDEGRLSLHEYDDRVGQAYAARTYADLVGLVDLLKRLMEANRTTGSQITTGDTRPGRPRWVAGRTGKPCRRCGTPIRKADQPSYDGERVTYWCPTCQPGPGPARGQIRV